MIQQKIGIPMGDPAGIGPEIVVKALGDKKILNSAKLIVIGDKKVIKKAIEITKTKIKINDYNIEKDNYKKEKINLIDLDNVKMDRLKFGEIQSMTGKAAFEYVEYLINYGMQDKIDAITTPPINKEALKAADIEYIGHTEMLADLTNTKNPLTMFQVHNLKVFFLSRHVSLKKACNLVKEERVYNHIIKGHNALERLGFKNPKIAVAGLNPHSGERGLFGNEEVEEIKPAVQRAKKESYLVEGPISADSVFHFGLKGKYDGILSLYHDQGHIATKMVDFEKTISITNNLPFLRTSVDHGTAFDISWQNKASDVSMKEAIKLAIKYAPIFSANNK